MGLEQSMAESAGEPLDERTRRAAKVVQLLRGIVRMHAEFNEDCQGDIMQIPTVPWPSVEPGVSVWGHLYNEMGGSIPKLLAEIAPNAREYFVGAAVICLAMYGESVSVMTIFVSPPEVLGADDKPMGVDQLSGAIRDMELYRNVLAAHQSGVVALPQ